MVEIAGGYEHVCARKSDGTVWCWGRNTHGQVGDGSTIDRTRPTQVSGLTNAVSIASGYHSCVQKGDGTTWCWGYNGGGSLGDGTTTNRSVPVRVQNDTGFVEVDVSGTGTCARKANGRLWCWGNNSAGEVGDGKVFVLPCEEAYRIRTGEKGNKSFN